MKILMTNFFVNCLLHFPKIGKISELSSFHWCETIEICNFKLDTTSHLSKFLHRAHRNAAEHEQVSFLRVEMFGLWIKGEWLLNCAMRLLKSSLENDQQQLLKLEEAENNWKKQHRMDLSNIKSEHQLIQGRNVGVFREYNC